MTMILCIAVYKRVIRQDYIGSTRVAVIFCSTNFWLVQRGLSQHISSKYSLSHHRAKIHLSETK